MEIRTKPENPDVSDLCFVTIGGGDRVFEDMKQSLASLRATSKYASHPVFVVDTGLTSDQRAFLTSEFDVVQFYNPESDFPKVGERHRSWLSIAYFPGFFSGYRYYFHLECDTWIQDESSIDRYVSLCQQQGWALDGYNIGIFCIDVEKGFHLKWQERILKNPLIAEAKCNELYRSLQLNFLKNHDQTRCPSFMYQHTKPGGPLGLINNAMVWHTGLPLLNTDGMLVDPVSLRVIGILHIHKKCEYIRAGNSTLLTRTADKALDKTQWIEHLEISRAQLVNGPSAVNDSRYTESISLRYGTSHQSSDTFTDTLTPVSTSPANQDTQQPEGDWGFLYSATGEKYVLEAIASASSYKKAMPEIPITIFTDLPELASLHPCFDSIEPIENPVFGPSDKFVSLKNPPYDKTVFVDTDTYCVEQCRELFRMLDRFDFAAAHAPVRAMNFVPKGIPRSFPELNTGVMAFRRCKSVRDMFEQWDISYQDFRERKNIKRDQLSFRKALYFSDVNLTILPPEYNLRPMFSYFIGGYSPVKIIHARDGDLSRTKKIAEQWNGDQSIYPTVIEIER